MPFRKQSGRDTHSLRRRYKGLRGSRSQEAISTALTKLLVGGWSSSRHDYLYRKDATWTMLPAEPGATSGKWRIDGNQYFDKASVLASSPNYTIILLTAKDFIFTDGEVVFFEKRKGK